MSGRDLIEKEPAAKDRLMPKPDAAPEAGTHADIAQFPFEKAMAELEAIVGRLERGDVALEESIAIYERGEALKARCESLLKQAEARVERITLSAEGKPTGAVPLDEAG
jgi:exodeoxyribonuclease VII small subunit